MREATLKRWLKREYESEKVKKLIGKIENGFLVLVHVCHSSGCCADQQQSRKGTIAGHVVQLNIAGTTSRNGKGTSVHERIMTVLATWAQQGPRVVSGC